MNDNDGLLFILMRIQLFVEVAQTSVWNIKLETQPPKLPHLNVLDLSIFRAL
jgi:hypothetical protein